jgi:hypothetical protein
MEPMDSFKSTLGSLARAFYRIMHLTYSHLSSVSSAFKRSFFIGEKGLGLHVAYDQWV